MSTVAQPQVNLAHRLDTLYAALADLETDPKTESDARELVTLIRASSEFRNMHALATAAQNAESADSNEFPAKLRTLIVLMHQEISRMNTPAATILIVSSDQALVTELQTGLESRGHPVVIVGTPSMAQPVLATQPVGVCIIDLVLTRSDGRNFITDLRANPKTAALLIVAIGPQLSPDESEKRSLNDADGFFSKPVKMSDVVSFLNLKLKRGPAKNREARRDPTTGAPNRAACYEFYAQIQKSCSDSDPISVALFGIHRFNTLVRNGGPVVRENLIRQLGSLLSSAFRASDVVARWGVSEFAVIMPGEDHYGATKAIEKVLPTLNKQTITTPAGKKIPITLCVGLTLVNNQTPLEDAAATAECHLYMAFHNAWTNPGKNWLVSDAIQTSRRSETIALFLSDPSTTKVLQHVLERETFKVERFHSAGTLESAISQQSFKLLITDDTFPSGEGFQLLERIRTFPIQKRLRTLMIVGDAAGIERSMNLGAHDYAIRPLAIPRFLSQIRRILWQREESLANTRMTVMVVDHEIPQLLIAGTALHQLGECRILLAHGARDALQRLKHGHPHYLILDMNMPGMSGEEFVNNIPNLDWLKNVEIIMAAPASATPPIPKTPFKTLGVVSRPYQPLKLIKEIRSLIPMLQDESLARPAVDPAPLESEVQRILTLQATHL